MHAGRYWGKLIGPYTEYLQQRGLLDKFREDYCRRQREGFATAAWDSVLETEDFADAYIGARATAWLEQVRDDYPWHLFVSFVGPHDPYDPPREYGEKYRDAPMPAAVDPALDDKPRYVHRRQEGATRAQIETCRRQYCAAIELIDDQVGLIINTLERRGMAANTHVIFASDHGDMLGDHGLFTKNAPYEASMRVPVICAGPGTESGSTTDAMTELIDINATICELAGLGRQEGVDAVSFAGLLRGETDQHREEVLSSLGHFRCVRTREWKYVDNAGDCFELYHMVSDAVESCNVVEEQPQVATEMAQRLKRRWLESGGER